jgi:hypothetical protein
VTSRRGKQGPVVYSCRKERGGCGHVAIVASNIEQTVVEEVGRWLVDEDLLAEANAILNGDRSGDLERAETEVAKCEARLAELARERNDLGLELVEWQTLRAPVAEALNAARAARTAAQRNAAAMAPLGAVTAQELGARWPDMSPEAQGRVIKVLAEVRVRSVGKGWRKRDLPPDRVVVTPVWDLPTAS